jgi:hypothetical protein
MLRVVVVSGLMIRYGAVLEFYPMASAFQLTVVLAAYLAVHAMAGLVLENEPMARHPLWKSVRPGLGGADSR